MMSVGVLFAIRDALNSARKDAGLSGWWQLRKFCIFSKDYLLSKICIISDGPATVEQINLHTGVNPDQFTF